MHSTARSFIVIIPLVFDTVIKEDSITELDLLFFSIASINILLKEVIKLPYSQSFPSYVLS